MGEPTTIPGARAEERHPDIDPQTPGGALRKTAAEAGEGDGPLDKAKRVLQEADRQFSGEYERREDPAVPEDDE
ncbi:MAG: hypothetical protein ABR498_00965 [Candidatus Dormibacteria bacterium]